MKKLGIIGGAGPLASALFYETLVQESYRQPYRLPEIFLLNYPFTRGLTLQEGKVNAKVLQAELDHCIQTLLHNAVDVGVVACNTLHLYLGLLPKGPLTFLSLPKLVLKQAQLQGRRRLLVLGTQSTCRSQLYRHAAMTMLYPPPKAQLLLDAIIDRVLEGKVRREDACSIEQLIQTLAKQMSFDGVILGCTDLPVLHHHFPLLSSNRCTIPSKFQLK